MGAGRDISLWIGQEAVVGQDVGVRHEVRVKSEVGLGRNIRVG